MNAIKLILTLMTVTGIIFTPFMSSQEQTSGEQIIQSFLKTLGKDIQPNTNEYQRFMRGILLGEYPELTGENSVFVTNQNELSLVLNYASNQSGYNELYGIYEEPNEPEAIYKDISFLSQIATISTLSHSRSMAVEYAYTWSVSGGG